MIENARLLREVQDRADESEGLRRVAEFAGRGHDRRGRFPADAARNLPPDQAAPPPSSTCSTRRRAIWSAIRSYGYGFQRTEPFVYDAYSKGYEHSVAISRRPFLSNDVADDKRVLPEYRSAARRCRH